MILELGAYKDPFKIVVLEAALQSVGIFDEMRSNGFAGSGDDRRCIL